VREVSQDAVDDVDVGDDGDDPRFDAASGAQERVYLIHAPQQPPRTAPAGAGGGGVGINIPR
jgi:hypothetical protein